jgi:hypothetical protein
MKKVTIITGFPPATSHRFQPLGESFFGPLKLFYDEVFDTIVVPNPDKCIAVAQTVTAVCQQQAETL